MKCIFAKPYQTFLVFIWKKVVFFLTEKPIFVKNGYDDNLAVDEDQIIFFLKTAFPPYFRILAQNQNSFKFWKNSNFDEEESL